MHLIKTIFLSAVLVPSFCLAQESKFDDSFTLKKVTDMNDPSKGQVCKVTGDVVGTCLPFANFVDILRMYQAPVQILDQSIDEGMDLISIANAMLDDHDTLQIDPSKGAQKALENLTIKQVGLAGARLANLTRDDLTLITDNFTHMSIRNIAAPNMNLNDANEIVKYFNSDTEELYVPLFFNLSYKRGVHITLNVEAYWTITTNPKSKESNGETVLEGQVISYSDNSPIETMARKLIISDITGVETGEVDEKTLEVLEKIVLPILINSLVAIPTALVNTTALSQP